jgi:hypothetical protein
MRRNEESDLLAILIAAIVVLLLSSGCPGRSPAPDAIDSGGGEIGRGPRKLPESRAGETGQEPGAAEPGAGAEPSPNEPGPEPSGAEPGGAEPGGAEPGPELSPEPQGGEPGAPEPRPDAGADTVTDAGADLRSNLKNGEPCVSRTECLSSYCVDGVCCDGSCSPLLGCYSCVLPGQVGTCRQGCPSGKTCSTSCSSGGPARCCP